MDSKIDGKDDDFVFIYYRGKNDAWDGYGGAVVYTKSPKLPESIIPNLQAAANRVNLNFNKFTTTDNTCGPEPPLLARLEKKVSPSSQIPHISTHILSQIQNDEISVNIISIPPALASLLHIVPKWKR